MNQNPFTDNQKNALHINRTAHQQPASLSQMIAA